MNLIHTPTIYVYREFISFEIYSKINLFNNLIIQKRAILIFLISDKPHLLIIVNTCPLLWLGYDGENLAQAFAGIMLN